VYGTFQYVTLARENEFASAGVVMLAAMPIILGAQMLLQAIVLDVGGVPRQPICPPIRAVGGASPVGTAGPVR
jgi:hypothetical protein